MEDVCPRDERIKCGGKIETKGRLRRYQCVQRTTYAKMGYCYASDAVVDWDMVCQISTILNSKQECQTMPARAEIANSASRTAPRGIIETILAFLDNVARTNARNKNNEPFGL